MCSDYISDYWIVNREELAFYLLLAKYVKTPDNHTGKGYTVMKTHVGSRIRSWNI